MTTLQLNQQLFHELSIISQDENKLKEAIAALKNIALGILPATNQSPNKSVVQKNSQTATMTDDQWAAYFSNTPAVDMPSDTETEEFVKKGKGRTIKQIEPWL
ncbi:hypothetical protein PRBRB14_04510 [Hallella multisaccharivorax DSM 17128]|uniref:Uncharacterized protein n=1 Tax=Hallella multisaccharivorax DSM 17128 TaxID=688246 RepID=F8N5R3_9BACT|nr:hypothetical protein [Hallella multisaccharivorax]EGN56075.1 hypothetical protein Premu_0599 [Hallella multisaccharivorax DSM 17128]GJG29572.1 hypothetical protein PRBRB14_04510 [Hallella multisaccharivorax DSM 17128]